MTSLITSQAPCADETSNSNILPTTMSTYSLEGASCADDERHVTRSPLECANWMGQVRETVVSTGPDGLLHITVLGGADTGSFCWIGGDPQSIQMVKCHSGKLAGNEILLEVDGEQVAGYTLGDLLRLLWSATDNGHPVLLKTVGTGYLTTDLKQFLSRRFQKDSADHDLQKTVRSNVYRRTLPCTTRSARQGEVDGLHYRFLSVDEFIALERRGGLLESGIYEGNYYGTPVPPKDPNGPKLQWNASINAGKSVCCKDGVKSADNKPAPVNSAFPQSTSSECVTSSPAFHNQLQQQTTLISRSNSNSSIANERSPSEDQSPLTPNSGNSYYASDLPDGWERIVDPVYGVYYIDHINKRTQYENPLRSPQTEGATAPSNSRTRRLVGQLIHVELIKSPTGLGFTIVASEDESGNLLLQIKTILPEGPASVNGRLRPGDVLVRVDGRNIVGFTHQDVAELFRSIQVGCQVNLDVCRGKYPLPFDPGDSQTQIITTVAVSPLGGADNSRLEGALCSKQTATTSNSHFRSRSYDVTTARDANCQPGRQMVVNLSRSSTEGVGFTISTARCHQLGVSCVRDVVDTSRCAADLRRGDVLLAVDGVDVSRMTPPEVMNVLKNCRPNGTFSVTVFRPAPSASSDSPDRDVTPARPPSCCLFPVTAGGTPMVSSPSNGWMTRAGPVISSISGTPDFIPASAYQCQSLEGATVAQQRRLANDADNLSTGRSWVDGTATRYTTAGTVVEKTICLRRRENGFGFRIVGGAEEGTQVCVGYLVPGGAADSEGHLKIGDVITAVNGACVLGASHHDVVRLISESANQRSHVTLTVCSHLDAAPSVEWYQPGEPDVFTAHTEGHVTGRDVTLVRRADEGYGFVIVSSLIKSGSVVGRLTPGGPADRCGLLHAGDHILAVNGVDISAMQHHEIVDLIRSAADLRLVLTVNTPPTTTMTMTSQHSAPSGDDEQLEVIELTRGSRGFGFSIRGGHEFGNLPLLVLKIADGGAAHSDGRLRVNDEILKINGIDTHGKTHSYALEAMQNGGPNIKLLVRHTYQAVTRQPNNTSPSNRDVIGSPAPPQAVFTRPEERRSVQDTAVETGGSSSELQIRRRNNRHSPVDQASSKALQCDSLDGSSVIDTRDAVDQKDVVLTSLSKTYSGSLV